MELDELKELPIGAPIRLAENGTHFTASGFFGGVVERGQNGNRQYVMRYFSMKNGSINEFIALSQTNPQLAEQRYGNLPARYIPVGPGVQIRTV